MARADQPERWHRYWNNKSGSYDKAMGFWDRHLFGDSREWVCSQATGEVLEVAIGTGLNIPFYPASVRVTGIDLSEGMLDLARARASESGRTIRLRTGNAHDLPFDDAAFDTVVCTFGLCAIPDVDVAVGEMSRVLRPGGALILVDHIESPHRVGRVVQRLLDLASVPLGGEHFRRRPMRNVERAGLTIERAERFGGGIVERLLARKREGQVRA